MSKVLLFDIGDTLIKTTGWTQYLETDLYPVLKKRYSVSRTSYKSAMTYVLKKIDRLSERNKHLDKIGVALDALLAKLDLEVGQKDIEKLKKIIINCRIKNVKEIDNSSKIIKKLSEKHKIYILTNARIDRTEELLRILGIESYITSIFISEKTKGRKETGIMYKKFLADTKINPRNCIMVGNDPIADAKTRDFGMKFCFLEKKRLHNFRNYDFKIDRLDKIYKILGSS